MTRFLEIFTVLSLIQSILSQIIYGLALFQRSKDTIAGEAWTLFLSIRAIFHGYKGYLE
jgi:hypothetical protein